MRNLLTMIEREFKALFVSPILWIVMVMFLVYQGLSFWAILSFLAQPNAPEGAPFQFFFGATTLYWIGFLVICSVIPMGAIASERRNGTLETLMTAPVTELEVIVSKFLASWGFFIGLWIPTLAYVLLLYHYSEGGLDLGPIWSGYLGSLLLGGAFISIGLLASVMTRNQIVAAVVAFGVNGCIFLLAIVAYLPSFMGAREELFNYLSVWNQMEDWGRGVVDTRHVVYAVSLIVFSLFCSVRLLEARRGR